MGKIGPRLLLMTNRKSHICTFDWCQNQRPWMTLKGHYALCFKTRVSFGAHHENLNEDRLYCQRRRCRPMTLDSGSMRFMWTFGLILKIYVNFPYILSLHPYITYTHTSRFFVIKFNCFVYDSYYRPIRLWRVVKCVTSRDVASEM